EKMKNQSLFCISCPCKRDSAGIGRNMLIATDQKPHVVSLIRKFFAAKAAPIRRVPTWVMN
ncbi:MAG: hypothetical protein OXI87_21315, partial [Albidovulum sp.]|nr:hypothetical protein [Albidovulum sp.]